MTIKKSRVDVDETARFAVEKTTELAHSILRSIIPGQPKHKQKDVQLLKACFDFGETHRQLEDLYTGKEWIATDDIRLGTEQSLSTHLTQALQVIATSKATTMAGHRARASSILVFDQGQILANANAGQPFDAALAALLVDLL